MKNKFIGGLSSIPLSPEPNFIISKEGKLIKFNSNKCRVVAEEARIKLSEGINTSPSENLAIFAAAMLNTCADIISDPVEADKIRNLIIEL